KPQQLQHGGGPQQVGQRLPRLDSLE
ncbi:unnamed protein product, partial [Rotaria sordida]